MRHALKATLCVAPLLISGVAFSQGAENYPSRPVTVVVPFAPGAATDIEGRVYTNKLSEIWGQQFIMDFKPGAVMQIGMNQALKQKPDGYTLVWVSSTYSLIPLLVKDLRYDPIKDFEQVSLMSKRSAILIVSNNLPVKNIKEFITYAKANPGKVNFATGGNGGIQHLTGLWLAGATDTKLTFIHYKSIATSYPDIMAGRTHMIPATFSAGYPMVKAGKVRGIAIASLARNSALPDLPTATEQGVPGFEYSSWLGLLAVGGTPRPIVNKLSAELAKIVKLPEIKEKMGTSTNLIGSTPEEFRKHAVAETARWRKLVQDNNIKLGK